MDGGNDGQLQLMETRLADWQLYERARTSCTTRMECEKKKQLLLNELSRESSRGMEGGEAACNAEMNE